MVDGGFKIFASKCGYKGDINQWQDLHNILTACYEALFRQAMEEFSKSDEEKKFEIFWEWVEKLRGDEHNQVCRFWAQMLVYLHAYTGFYFAVRSGNWLLRISCLKVLTELFFAYSRDKYEVVSTNALADSYTYPAEILEEFRNGQWTVSVKGRPFHSLKLMSA